MKEFWKLRRNREENSAGSFIKKGKKFNSFFSFPFKPAKTYTNFRTNLTQKSQNFRSNRFRFWSASILSKNFPYFTEISRISVLIDRHQKKNSPCLIFFFLFPFGNCQTFFRVATWFWLHPVGFWLELKNWAVFEACHASFARKFLKNSENFPHWKKKQKVRKFFFIFFWWKKKVFFLYCDWK